MPHIHDKIDFCTEVFVVFGNKVLLRMHDKYDIWLGPGGHIELDEDPDHAAIREVKEEVGLDVQLFQDTHYPMTNREGFQELLRPQFVNRHRINETHEHICFYYFATSNTDQLILSRNRKKRWVPLVHHGRS